MIQILNVVIFFRGLSGFGEENTSGSADLLRVKALDFLETLL